MDLRSLILIDPLLYLKLLTLYFSTFSLWLHLLLYLHFLFFGLYFLLRNFFLFLLLVQIVKKLRLGVNGSPYYLLFLGFLNSLLFAALLLFLTSIFIKPISHFFVFLFMTGPDIVFSYLYYTFLYQKLFSCIFIHS